MHDRRRKGARDFKRRYLDCGEFALSFFVPTRRGVLRASDFHAQGSSGASIAERYRGLLRVTALVSGVSIALIAGLTFGVMPAAAQIGGNGGGSLSCTRYC
jgi:hypothetical protein